MGIFRKWLLGVIAVGLTIVVAQAIGITLKWENLWGVVVFVPVLAITNAVLGTIIRLFTLPITLMTLGLFGLVINALMFWIAGTLTGAKMDPVAPFFGPIAMTVFSSVLNTFNKKSKR